MTDQPRLEVNINAHTADDLRAYTEAHGVSITEALRRLLGIGAIVARAQADGADVLFRRGRNAECVEFGF